MLPYKNGNLFDRHDSTPWFEKDIAGSEKKCTHFSKVVYLCKGLLLYDLVEKKSQLCLV
jgi:hypothetical protein